MKSLIKALFRQENLEVVWYNSSTANQTDMTASQEMPNNYSTFMFHELC